MLEIVLKRPDLYEQAKELFTKEDQKQLDIFVPILLKNKGQLTEKSLLLISDEKQRERWAEALKATDIDVSVLIEAIKSSQEIEYRTALQEHLFDDNLDIPLLEKKYKTFQENIVESEFEVKGVNDLFTIWQSIEDESNIGKIPSGYSAINNLIEGGFKNGSSICWLGPSGSGKTLWLCNEAANIWHGQEKRVLYISTEMNEKAIFSRILRSAFNSSKDKMVDKLTSIKTSNHYNWPQIKVIKVHPNDTNCDEIQEKIDKLEWKPEVIIIDYFDEIRATEKSANEYDKHGIVASDIKKLAEVNNCPVITATQANRSALDESGGSKEIVSAVNIGDSYKKVRTLDLLLCIIQPNFLKSANKYELYIDKNRYGPSNTSVGQFDIDWDTMKITSSNTLTTNPSKTKTRHDKALDNFEQQKFEDAKKAQADTEEDPTIQKYILAWNKENIVQYVKNAFPSNKGNRTALSAHLGTIKRKTEGAN